MGRWHQEKKSIFTYRCSCLSAELREATVTVEGFEGEQAAAAVAEDQEPPGFDPARGRERAPPAPQERTVTVPLDPDAPALAVRADDEGLLGGYLRGELIRDALRRRSKISAQLHGRSGWFLGRRTATA
jgi:hypothetical protein